MIRAINVSMVFALWIPLLVGATTCEQAELVEALPYQAPVVDSGSNDIRANNAENCVSASYYGGNEALLRFTAGFSGEVSVAYQGQSWTAVVVYAGCPTSGGSCVGGVASSATSKSLVVDVEAGQEYFILVDTWPSPISPVPGVITIEGQTLPDPIFFDGFEGLPDR